MVMIIDMDIEALNMNYIRGGFKAGEMMIISTARRTGKSLYYSAIYNTNLCKEILLPMNPEPKYKFSRAKWYTVGLNGNATWRFSDEYNQIIAWCTENFGAHPSKPDAWSRWYVGLGYINFRDAKDYEWYVLRWS
jgi:hypothetical protein